MCSAKMIGSFSRWPHSTNASRIVRMSRIEICSITSRWRTSVIVIIGSTRVASASPIETGFAWVARSPNATARRWAPTKEQAQPQEQYSSLEALEGLGVVIDFDVGRMSIPLAQVQTWQPGTVVSIDPPALNPGVEVTIRANGQVIGI